MPFNWNTFRTRSLTAAIFVVVMFAGLLINQWTFLILFSVIHFGCWWEYLKLVEKISHARFHKYLKLGLMLIGYGLVLLLAGPAYKIGGHGLTQIALLPVSLVGFVLTVVGIFRHNHIDLKSFAGACLGFLYISLSLGLMINMRDTVFPLFIPLVIIASMWVNDTMAYIIGSLIGRTPLSSISPKKTWEGTIAGVVLCILTVGLLLQYVVNVPHEQQMSTYHFYILPAVASISGVFGDLLESKLKRASGVKDSGHIMPGHGGFLDRFDSLLVATPFVWIYVYLFLK